MNRLLVFQVVLPLVINLIAGALLIFLPRPTRKLYRLIVFLVMALVLAGSLYYAYILTPELVVVPDLRHQWKDQATDLCNKVGLRVKEPRRRYGERQNEVLDQSLVPGSLVFAGTEIEMTICVGSLAGDPMYGIKEDAKEVNK
jgi:beta-lactam-binding protein with PASTA domain